MKQFSTLILITLFSFSTMAEKQVEKTEIATLAGGCFWCTEAIFKELKGVLSVTSGYSGGDVVNPSYREVCTGQTGHAEAVEIEFDPTKTSFTEILEVFFATHDPTTLNKQGADVGTQYRSAIFYHNDKQKQIAEEVIQQLNDSDIFGTPVVTEVSPWKNFFKAEDYHQDYLANNAGQSYCQFVIIPKLEKFRKIFKDRLKSSVK
ncbi:peptide-methionine (S)-S-oxide reductase MsrA [Mangrovibacterium marinum]|uniref:Peptide methionine sulfoxide reductase MsrA n=1 Tax=Mangrovibacterium marinum TaxID=1639118 RepID=A0A2T5BY66_9BACT|nr:peptide-methionine (S)-S-oxide reductase MsrA [Mangrovibacterium marinum]PTN06773.1 peptide-methionine (S)-S-oxide reductase [Mangrovibacterium marinum]